MGLRDGPMFTNLTSDLPHQHLKGIDKAESKILSCHSEQYEGVKLEELILQLKEADTLHEQADIIHFLFVTE